jgi:hypothetical protein
LICNPKAGAERKTGEELGDLIRAEGRDVTRHSSKGGSRHFVESVGMGLLAWSIPQADSSAMLHHMNGAQRKLAYVRKMLADRLEHAPLLRCKASLDGRSPAVMCCSKR